MFVTFYHDGQEEQHANTSANYDVELLHHRDAHMEFFKSGRSSFIYTFTEWVLSSRLVHIHTLAFTDKTGFVLHLKQRFFQIFPKAFNLDATSLFFKITIRLARF